MTKVKDDDREKVGKPEPKESGRAVRGAGIKLFRIHSVSCTPNVSK